MKKKTAVALVVGIMLILGAAGAFAADFMDRINDQQRRIDQGIASGTLTRQEADLLQDNLNWIKVKFAQLKADGRLNSADRRELDAMLDRNDKMIANKKHNPIAKVYGEDFQDRIQNQQRRIDQGIASGTLTRQEADLVQDNLNWIKTKYASMKADGRMSRKEIQKLEMMLDQNSNMIQNKKSNPVRRLY